MLLSPILTVKVPATGLSSRSFDYATITFSPVISIPGFSKKSRGKTDMVQPDSPISLLLMHHIYQDFHNRMENHLNMSVMPEVLNRASSLGF
jgi:hypothetical protein